METVLTPPLFEEGDLVTFIGYKCRNFNYDGYKSKKENYIGKLGCPFDQEYGTFLVIKTIPAKKLFKKNTHCDLTYKDNGYVIISQKDTKSYFAYENELLFL
jgi:hypothetical protein